MILAMSDHWLLITVWIQRTINYCLSMLDNARLCAKSDSLLGQNVHPRPSRRNLEQSRRHRPAWRCDVHSKHYRPRRHSFGRVWGSVIESSNNVVRWRKIGKLWPIFIFQRVHVPTVGAQDAEISLRIFSSHSWSKVEHKREFRNVVKRKFIHFCFKCERRGRKCQRVRALNFAREKRPTFYCFSKHCGGQSNVQWRENVFAM